MMIIGGTRKRARLRTADLLGLGDFAHDGSLNGLRGCVRGQMQREAQFDMGVNRNY